MGKVYFSVEIPDALLGELLQVIRDFDIKHDPHHEGKVHVESLTETDWPVEKMAAVYQALTPSFKHMAIRKFDKDEA